MTDDAGLNLLMSLFLIPVAIWLHIWVRKRKENRRNESGDEEFGSLGSTLISTIGEGIAIITSLILMIMVMGFVLKYFFPQIFGTQL
ncbi:MAG: hypothetical protein CMH70_07920 [Nitrosomonadaceae bacterium]|nr:hypothetical protein [Nitrosomonadaceae bacterium]|tara:strand:- start:3297 stop:3557 length:261 start_codon:yes stop_codon:yes gene_type:complete